MGITKNRQTNEKLAAMAAVAFPGKRISDIAELTEGLFNVAYRLGFDDGSSTILKIASARPEGLLSNEVNLMQAEVAAMEVARQHGLPYVPQVYYADFSRTLCNGTFFFMEEMPGRSLSSSRDELAAETVESLMRETGAFQRRVKDIKGETFGLLGDEKRFDTLHGLTLCMLERVLGDAQRRNIPLLMEPEEALALLQSDKPLFDEVAVPTLVHWDMWEGNIFHKDGKLSGIIDWERALWGECFMDDRFRRHTRPQAFLEGFGQTTFTPAEARRICWYDLILYLTMYVEAFYREYDPSENFSKWIHSQMDMTWKELRVEQRSIL